VEIGEARPFRNLHGPKVATPLRVGTTKLLSRQNLPLVSVVPRWQRQGCELCDQSALPFSRTDDADDVVVGEQGRICERPLAANALDLERYAIRCTD
jgi:hypothetical protein